MVKCVACDAELTNGLDTFGGINEERCWDCFITAKVAEPDVIDLKKELKKELEQAEDDYEELQHRIDALQDEQDDVANDIEKLKNKIKIGRVRS